jgi:hypothetical protein
MAHDHNALSNSKLYTNMACWLLIIWPDPLVRISFNTGSLSFFPFPTLISFVICPFYN